MPHTLQYRPILIDTLISNARIGSYQSVFQPANPSCATAPCLTENVQREAMHSADQFAAFAALVAEGRPIEDVAADFSVTPLVVQRRLKLANVSPRLMMDYRADLAAQLVRLARTADRTRD